MTPVLVADSVGKAFGGRAVLKSASLWLHAGTVTALMGRNGAGKSTLIRIAVGLLAPDYGAIRFRDRIYARTRLHVLARQGLFYLPERSLLSRAFTLADHARAFAPRASRAEIEAAAEHLGIAHVLDRYPHELSGGERRRADLALALLRKPACLVADELFLGVTPKDAELFGTAIRRLADQDGCAVLVTGHEVHTVLDVADDVAWLTAGTTHALGAPQAARAHDQFRREYLAWRYGGFRGRPATHVAVLAASRAPATAAAPRPGTPACPRGPSAAARAALRRAALRA